MYSNEEVVQYRLNEIYNELMDLENEAESLKAKLERNEYLRKVRSAEYRMLQNVKERGAIVAEGGRISRVQYEDVLKKIFDKTGRPMTIGELRDELERFGFDKGNYARDYQRLTDILIYTGARGYYQYK